MPTDSIFHAIWFGMLSGITTTGSQQMIVQIKQFVVENKNKTVTVPTKDTVTEEKTAQNEPNTIK